jgi:hypothetical protein
MRSFVLRVAAVALALFAIPRAADAGWTLAGQTTTVQAANSPTNDTGVISYGVYNNSNADFFTAGVSGLSSANLTAALIGSNSSLANDKYIYVYEMTNVNSATALVNLFIQDNNNAILDASTIVGEKFSSTFTTLNASAFTTGADSYWTNATPQPERTYPPLTPAYEFTLAQTGGYAALGTGQSSSIVIIGSNAPPVTGQGETGDGGWADGAIPVPSPEPGTFALIGLGLPLLGWGYVRRLRANKAVLAAAAV